MPLHGLQELVGLAVAALMGVALLCMAAIAAYRLIRRRVATGNRQ